MFNTALRVFILAALAAGAGCSRGGPPHVVLYAALDEMYSKPILDGFKKRTGINVRAVYDTEASKTTGLTSRLVAEHSRPRADLFWSNEAAQTIVLANKGVLEPYSSPASAAIPPQFKDPKGRWTGLAARARVIIYNTDLVETPPASIRDLLKPEWRGRCAIARPLFGTTATHAAALFAAWGEEEAKRFFRALLENEVAILSGNATVRDLVAAGEYAWGLTDTDDANGAIEDGKPVKWLFPDQEEGGLGTLVIPNTVAVVRGGPNPNAARLLYDYLLSPEVESALARSRSIQIPLNPAVSAPENVPDLPEIRTMDVSFDSIAESMEPAMAFVREEFAR